MVGETIFAAQGKRDEAIKFRNAVRARMPVHGRDPELLRILPCFVQIMGATEKEALEKVGVKVGRTPSETARLVREAMPGS